MTTRRLLTCEHCDEAGYAEDGDFQVDKQQQGFWCETCDRYNYLDKNAVRHRFKLILEKKDGPKNAVAKPPHKFAKQLSPYRYPGGKSKVIDYLYHHLHESRTKLLVSPFTGGGSFELAMLEAGVVDSLHLNDLDFGVFSFWSIVRDDPAALIDLIRTVTPTHADYFAAQAHIKANYDGLSGLDAAWCSLLVNRLAYSGVAKANPLGGRHGDQASLLSRWKPEVLIKRIQTIHDMRERFIVTQQPAVALIEEAYWNDEATLFIDPPYVAKGKALYQCFYTMDDHYELCALLDSLHGGFSGADIVLTYDYHETLEFIYDTPDIEYLTRIYSA